MRTEIELNTLRMDEVGTVEDQLKIVLLKYDLPFSVEKSIRFWAQAFTHKGTFTVYDNGKIKSATLRFRDGAISIPKYHVLPIYESGEFKRGMKPRGFATIETLVIGNYTDFTLSELARDGFTSHAEILPDMKKYYQNVNNNSIFTYFLFGTVKFKPTASEIQSYFSKRT
jgi:hypothetical protein